MVEDAPQRRDDHDVSSEVEGAELGEVHRLVEVVDRHVIESAEGACVGWGGLFSGGGV